MKITAILTFLFLLLPVAAIAADPACRTTNLLDDLAESAPAHYEAIRTEADAVPNSKGVFWQVTHPNLKHTSYLFGTIHKADPRVVDLPGSVLEAFDASATLAVELTDPRGGVSKNVALLRKPGLFFPGDGQRLSDRIDPDTIPPLTAYLSERGIKLSNVDMFRPWVAIGILTLSTCDLDYRDAPILDEVLIKRAKVAGKQLVGLETPEEQVTVLSEIDEQIYLSAIEETARGHESGLSEDILRTAIQLYLDEEIAALGPLSVYYSEQLTSDPNAAQNYAVFEQKLLDSRNGNLALKSAFQMAKGPTFVAVGAGHLYGETGLVANLRNRGFTVTRIPLER